MTLNYSVSAKKNMFILKYSKINFDDETIDCRVNESTKKNQPRVFTKDYTAFLHFTLQ